MKLRLRVIDPTEAKAGDLYCVVALLHPKRNPQQPSTFDQKLAILEVFSAPAMEWTPVEVAAMPSLLVKG